MGSSWTGLLLYVHINYSELRGYGVCVGKLSMQTIHAHVMHTLIYVCIILQLSKKNLPLRNKVKLFWRLFDFSLKYSGVWKTFRG